MARANGQTPSPKLFCYEAGSMAELISISEHVLPANLAQPLSERRHASEDDQKKTRCRPAPSRQARADYRPVNSRPPAHSPAIVTQSRNQNPAFMPRTFSLLRKHSGAIHPQACCDGETMAKPWRNDGVGGGEFQIPLFGHLDTSLPAFSVVRKLRPNFLPSHETLLPVRFVLLDSLPSQAPCQARVHLRIPRPACCW
jgi:hypothetical protein